MTLEYRAMVKFVSGLVIEEIKAWKVEVPWPNFITQAVSSRRDGGLEPDRWYLTQPNQKILRQAKGRVQHDEEVGDRSSFWFQSWLL